MNWNQLASTVELEEIKEVSKNFYVLIFKHSTKCSASRTALNRVEKYWSEEEMKDVKPYYLDLIAYRDVSNKIAGDYSVRHDSPQILIIKDGECIYNESHQWINYEEIKKTVLTKKDGIKIK